MAEDRADSTCGSDKNRVNTVVSSREKIRGNLDCANVETRDENSRTVVYRRRVILLADT